MSFAREIAMGAAAQAGKWILLVLVAALLVGVVAGIFIGAIFLA